MDITADGTIFNCIDTVALRPGNPLDRMDLSSAKKDVVMGTIIRPIQWHYRVVGDPTVYDWCIAVSTYTAYGDGRLERTRAESKRRSAYSAKPSFRESTATWSRARKRQKSVVEDRRKMWSSGFYSTLTTFLNPNLR